MSNHRTVIEMEEVTDAEELTKARQQRERFDCNAAWLQSHIADVYARYRGKYICAAGQELFVADTVKEAIALATAAHPEDDGWFIRFIPKEKMARVL
jgi:hypothetical protein